jgi:hypothetical protein
VSWPPVDIKSNCRNTRRIPQSDDQQPAHLAQTQGGE